jgi:2,3-bisphosphoglycerate-independent phosphoglycerate mutase
LSAKKEALVRHLTPVNSDYSFGFLHVKAVDDAGHDKNRSLKVCVHLTSLTPMLQQLASGRVFEQNRRYDRGINDCKVSVFN